MIVNRTKKNQYIFSETFPSPSFQFFPTFSLPDVLFDTLDLYHLSYSGSIDGLNISVENNAMHGVVVRDAIII